MKPDFSLLSPTQMSLATPVKTFGIAGQKITIFLAPNGQLAAVDSADGRKIWTASIPDFVPTTMGTAMTVHPAGKLRVLTLQLGEKIYVYNALKGTLMGRWTLENATLLDTTDFFYDDDLARARTSILVERLHPFVDKKALFIVKDNVMNVYGIEDEGVALTAFWERLMLTGLVAVVLGLFMRQISADQLQKE